MVDPSEYWKKIQEERNKANEYSQQALRQRQQLDEYSQQALRQQQLLKEKLAGLPTSYSQKELRQTQAGIGGFERRQKTEQFRTDATKAVSEIDQSLVDVQKSKEEIDKYIEDIKTYQKDLDKAEQELKDWEAQVAKYQPQPHYTYSSTFSQKQNEVLDQLSKATTQLERQNILSGFLGKRTSIYFDRDEMRLLARKYGQDFVDALIEVGGITPQLPGGMKRVSQAEKEFQMESQRPISIQTPKEIEVNPEVRRAFEAKYGVGATVGIPGMPIGATVVTPGRFQELTKDGQIKGYYDNVLKKEIDVRNFGQHLTSLGIIPQSASKDIDSTFKEYNMTVKEYNEKISRYTDNQGRIIPGQEGKVEELQRIYIPKLEVQRQACDAAANAANMPPTSLIEKPAYYISKGFEYAGKQVDVFGSTLRSGLTPIGREVVGGLFPQFNLISGFSGGPQGWETKIEKYGYPTTTASKLHLGAYFIPFVGAGLVAADVLGFAGRSSRYPGGFFSYVKEHPLETAFMTVAVLSVGADVAKKLGVEPLKFERSELKVSTGEPIKIRYAYGKFGEKIVPYGGKFDDVWRIGNVPVKEIPVGRLDLAKRGFHPETPVQTAILARRSVIREVGRPYGITPEQSLLYAERIKTGRGLSYTLGSERSAYVQSKLPREIKSLSREGVEGITRLAKQNARDVEFYGHFGAKAQIKPGIISRTTADVDLQLKLNLADSEKFAQRVLEKLRRTEGTENVRINPQKSTLIDSLEKGGNPMDPNAWHHAVDIHSVEEMAYGAPEMGYGFVLREKPVKIEGFDVMSIGEQLKRKTTASTTWFKGEEGFKVSALPYRMKDIGDVLPLGKTLTASIRTRPSVIYKFPKIITGERLLAKWKSLYPEVNWQTVKPGEGIPLVLRGEELLTKARPLSSNLIKPSSAISVPIRQTERPYSVYGGLIDQRYPYKGYSPYLGTKSPSIGYPPHSKPVFESPSVSIGYPKGKQQPYGTRTSLVSKSISPSLNIKLISEQRSPSLGTTSQPKKSPLNITIPYAPTKAVPEQKQIPMISPIARPSTFASPTTPLIGRTWPTSPIIVSKKVADEEKRKKKRMAWSWRILVRRRGAWNYLTGEYTRGEAMRVGAEKTMTTLGRTFKIVPYRLRLYEGEEPSYLPSEGIFRRYRIIRGIKHPLQDIWIQRAPKSLMTRSEVREIQAARRRASQQEIFKSNRRKKIRWF